MVSARPAGSELSTAAAPWQPTNQNDPETAPGSRPPESAMSASNQDSSTNSSSSNGNTPAPSTAATSTTTSTSQDDSLVCKWNQCNERFTAAEALYVS